MLHIAPASNEVSQFYFGGYGKEYKTVSKESKCIYSLISYTS